MLVTKSRILILTILICLVSSSFPIQPSFGVEKQNGLGQLNQQVIKEQDRILNSNIKEYLLNNIKTENIENDNSDNVNFEDYSSQDPEIQKIIAEHLINEQAQANMNIIDSTIDSKSNLQNYGLTDQYIIKFKNNIGSKLVEKKLTPSVKGKINKIEENLNSKIIVIKTKNKLHKSDFISLLEKESIMSDIEYIQPDYVLTISSENPENNTVEIPSEGGLEIGNDPLVNRQWGIWQEPYFDEETGNIKDYRIDANVKNAWSLSQGEGVIVAVLDTGVDITHEDLFNNIWVNTSEIPDNGVDDDGNGYIDDYNGWDFINQTKEVHNETQINDEWHGTHIAGIIGAECNGLGIIGVAPKVKIMPLKVFENGKAYTSDILEAIEYAKQNGATIVNCSWGTSSYNKALEEAISSSEMLFITAAGNNHRNIDNEAIYPSSFTSENIISVTSINKVGNLSNFSNFGVASVDVAAPGEEIISTIPGNEYGESSGTSQATAFVSGEVALILSKYPEATYQEIKSRVINSSDRLTCLEGMVYNSNKINCLDSLKDTVEIKNELIYVENLQGENTEGDSDSDSEYNLYSIDEWNSRSSMLSARYNFGTAEVGGAIYAIGGYNGTTYLNTMESYNPITNTWVAKANMTTARHQFGTATVNGKIYVIGGMNSSGTILNTVEEYNPINNTWTSKANIQTPRYGFGIAVVNGKIYIIGGATSSNTLNSVEEYDPINNVWVTKVSMVVPRKYLSCESSNGKIYAIGGYKDGSGYVNSVEEFNPANNTWSTKASAPVGKAQAAIVQFNDKIYTIGGTDGLINYDRVDEYNITTDSWGTRNPLLSPRYGLCAAVLRDKIYIMGGNNGTVLNKLEEYGVPSVNWSSTLNMPDSRMNAGVGIAKEKVYIIGGYDGENYLNSVMELDKSTNSWIVKNSMPTERAEFKTIIVNGLIYAIGGYNNSGYLDAVEVYNTETDTWISKTNMPTAKSDFALCIKNNDIYAIGGFNGDLLSSVETYNIQTDIWSIKTNLPEALKGLGATFLNGNLYAVGGYNGTNYVNSVYEYNILSNSWTSKLSMPTPRASLGVETVGGKIYAFGGFNGSALNLVEEFDPISNTWTKKVKENMIQKKYSFASLTNNGKIFVFGGIGEQEQIITNIDEYSPIVSAWKSKTSMPVERVNFATVTLNGKIYVIGGETHASSSTTGSVLEYDPVNDVWLEKASLNYARTGLTAAVVNGKIYAIGGMNTRYNDVNIVEEYDPIANTWTVKASMSTSRSRLASAVIDGKIYVIGGQNGYVPLNIVEEYNPAANSWTTKAVIPTARYAFSAVSGNGKIYAIGGNNVNNDGLYSVEEYNPTTNTWTTKSSMLKSRAFFAATEVNGFIYAVGGYLTNTVEKYDYMNNNWSSEASLPTDRGDLGVASVNGKIYAIGGDCSQFNAMKTVEEFDTGISIWNTKNDVVTARKDFGIAVVNNKIYIAGGNNGSSFLNTVEEFDRTTNKWTLKESMPTARSQFGMTAIDGKIYAIGGYDGSTWLNNVEEYDPITNLWSTKPVLPTRRGQLAVTSANGKVYAIGGYNGTSYLTTVEEYNPPLNTWTSKLAMPTGRSGLCATAIDNKVYAIGGYNGAFLDKVEEYNPITNTWLSKAVMPMARAYSAISTMNDKIYVFGGANSTNNYLDITTEYNPNLNLWATKTAMPTTRGNAGAATIGNEVYVIGGTRYSNTSIILNTVESYSPLADNNINIDMLSGMRKGLQVVNANGKYYIIGGKNETGYIDNMIEYASDWYTANLSMASPREDFGAAVIDGKIYIAGGYNGTTLDSLEEYDIDLNSWTTKASMTIPRKGLTLTSLNGRLYAIGGQNDNDCLNIIEEYDPYSNTWTVKSNLQFARSYAGACAINGNIYVVGGKNNTPISSIEMYNPITNQCLKINSDLPTAKYEFGVAVLGNKFFVLGGNNGNNYFSTVEVFDTNTKKWDIKPNILIERSSFGATGFGERILLAGGINAIGSVDTVETYCPDSIVWKRKADMPTSKRDNQAVSLNGVIYSIGGYLSTNLNKLEAYDIATNTWSTKASMATARREFAAAVCGGKIYVFGGLNQSYLNSTEEYNPVSNTWVTKATMPVARRYANAVTVNDKIYVIGGYDGTSNLNRVDEYNPATNTWATKANIPTARQDVALAVLSNKIYAISGYVSQSTSIVNSKAVEVFDPIANTWETKAQIPIGAFGVSATVVNGKIYTIDQMSRVVREYDVATDKWKERGISPITTWNIPITSYNDRIYILSGPGDSSVDKMLIEGTLEKMGQNPVADLIHFGEESVNISGNYARNYTDMEINVPGFNIEFSRTYNSRDYRSDSPFSMGWTFGFQGSIKDFDADKKIVRLPKGEAATFIKNIDGSFTANDSRSTLIKQADNTYVLTTQDQYSYGFNETGWLNWMKDRNGNIITLTVGTDGKVTQIIDQNNRVINITYTSGKITLITDFAGRTIQYQYTNNNLTKVIDPLNKSTNYVYNTYGYLCEIRDHDNNLIEAVTYDYSRGLLDIRISTIEDNFLNINTYSYDEEFRKVTTIDSNGRQIITWNDSSLYPIAIQDPEGRKEITLYNIDGNSINNYGEVQSKIDRNGNTYIYERDNSGNIIKMYNPDSSFREYGYDVKNNKIWEKDENGKSVFYMYDSNNINLVKAIKPLNGTDEYTAESDESNFAITTYIYYTDSESQSLGYKPKALLKSFTDPEGNVTSYTYDANGNIKTVTNPEDKVTTNTYDSLGRIISIKSPGGFDTGYVYDNNGNLEKVTQHGGEVRRIIYDNLNRKVKEVSPNLYNSSYDNLLTHSYTGDHGERYGYYASGAISWKKDSNNYITNYAYDMYGNIVTETKPNGAIYQYTYDVLNRLDKIYFKKNSTSTEVLLFDNDYLILPDGKTTETRKQYLNSNELAVTILTYDYAGRIIRTDNADLTFTTITYNMNGTIQSTTDAMGNETFYQYDGFNRITNVWSASNSTSQSGLYSYKSRSYDKAGNLVLEKIGKNYVNKYEADNDCITIQNSYYKDGQLKLTSNSAGNQTEYWYDGDGNVNRKSVLKETDKKITTEYLYNYLNKPVWEKIHVRAGDLFGNDISNNEDTLVQTKGYTYNKNGNLLTVIDANNITATYNYDNNDNLISASEPGENEYSSASAITANFTYNWENMILTESNPLGHSITYTYNEAGDKIKEEESVTVNEISRQVIRLFDYDLAHRLTAEVTPNNYEPSKSIYELNRTEYSYDKMGRVLQKKEIYKVDDLFKTVISKAYQYDANGNAIVEKDSLGVTGGYGKEYTYNAGRQITSVLEPEDAYKGALFTIKYTYDAIGRLKTETNGNGVIKEYDYDDASNIIAITLRSAAQNPEVVILQNAYDKAGNLISKTDGNGNITLYEYNDFGLLRKEILASDPTVEQLVSTYQYDVVGNLKERVSNGVKTSFVYDNQRRILESKESNLEGQDAISNTRRYDLNGNAIFITDGNGNVTQNKYDELNRLVETKISTIGNDSAATVHTTKKTYDNNNNIVLETDRLGNSSSYRYDPLNRLIEKTDADNVVIEKLVFNDNNVQVKSIDGCNNETIFEYDRSNRLIKKVDPELNETSMTYDGAGNVSTKTDGEGNTTAYQYNGFNKLSKVMNALNEESVYRYDNNANLISQMDGKGNTAFYEYNARNLPVKRIDAGGRTGTEGSYVYNEEKMERYTYYPNGLIKEKIDRNGVTTSYTYDVHGRLLTETAGSLTVANTYDNNGNKLTMNDATGTTVRTYDALNRCLTKTVPDIGTTVFDYDKTNTLPAGFVKETVTDPKNNIVTRVFDKTGKLKEVIDNEGQKTTYEYYENGLKKAVIYQDGTREDYTFYDNNQLQTLVNKGNTGTVLAAYSYIYDKAGNQIQKNDSTTGITTYAYDELNRLIKVDEPDGKVVQYTYDRSGNRETESITAAGITTILTYIYNEQNRLMSIHKNGNEITTYSYDNNGNNLSYITETLQPVGEGLDEVSTEVFVVGDITGQQGTLESAVYEYDTFNQMIQSSINNSMTRNRYNGEGLRVEKEVNGEITRYLYEGDRVILEVNENNQLAARNTIGTNIISRVVVEGGSTEKLYYLYNGHGDVTALISPQGNIVAEYTYNAFGTPRLVTGTADNPYRYAGYQYDDESGLYYLQSRMYNPVIARFMQEDTYRGQANDPLSLNLYVYCANNPIKYWDPDGHVTTAWDTKKLSRAQQAALSIQNWLYESRTAQGDTAGAAQAHADAETIRNTARSSSEVGSASGYTYKVSSDGSASLNKYDSAALAQATNGGGSTLNGSSYIPERDVSAEKIIIENFNSILPAFMPMKSTNNIQPNQNAAQGQSIDNSKLYAFLPIDIYNTYNYIKAAVEGSKKLTQAGKLDWFLMLSLAATPDGNNKYHISQNYWQALDLVGYCKFYDMVADTATSIAPEHFDFMYNHEAFRLWAWKGDYINLGAGAELGIYHGGGPIWKTGEEYAMPMTLTLDYKKDRIISYDPIKDDPKGKNTDKWWITGFDPSTPDVLAKDLKAVYTLDFSQSKEMKRMYDAFYDAWSGVDSRWDFLTEYHPVFTFGEVK